MSHRTRLTAVLVDVPGTDLDRTTSFWTAALGKEPKTNDKLPEYRVYGEVTPGIEFMVQATNDPGARVHFDIETDDVEAEVARLKDLGATELGRRRTWVIMQDPAGTVFCVVRVQVKEMFDQHATTWD